MLPHSPGKKRISECTHVVLRSTSSSHSPVADSLELFAGQTVRHINLEPVLLQAGSGDGFVLGF